MLRETMAVNALAKVRSMFDDKKIADDVSRLYTELGYEPVRVKP